MALHWIDYVIIAIIGLSVLTGLFRGFVKELMALVVWILAIWLAIHYSNNLDQWLKPYLQDEAMRKAAAFIIILLLTLIAGGLVNALLSFILKRSGLSGTDRLLGMGFGFMRGIFLVALGILVVKGTAGAYEKQYTPQSQFYTKFDPLVNWLGGFMPEIIKLGESVDKKPYSIDIATDS